jgi:very-short-patch-repair endonuclease
LRPSRMNMRGGVIMTRRVRTLRRDMTIAERALWWELRRNNLGRRFRRQFPISPYIVDFACIEAKLIVEADGGHHSLPGEHERRDDFLRRRGWRVLRFWNNDVLGNPAGVLQTIAAALNESALPNPPPPAGEGVPFSVSRDQ